MSALRMIGHYQYNEPHPTYARYQLPGINSNNAQNVSVEIIGKKAFIPVVNPSDYLVIQCIPALKEMMSALKKSENEPDSVKANQIIAAGTVTACKVLDAQLDHQLGSGRVIGINVVGSSVGQNDPVANLW
jgi:hypothetical protein